MAEIVTESIESTDTKQADEETVRDYTLPIADLRRRAGAARTFRAAIAAGLVLGVLAIAAYIFEQFATGGRFNGFKAIAERMEQTTDRTPSAVFLRPVDDILHTLYPNPLLDLATKLDTGKTVPQLKFSDDVRDRMLKEVDTLVTLYERSEKARAAAKPQGPSDNIAPIISTVAFSAGAVVLLILLIQIGVSFMRYYAQLAELYDSQALALEASSGKADVAIKFAEHFSPNSITFGKLPTTLYEKSLDTIAELVRAKIKS